MWTDILRAGIAPKDVAVVVFGEGDISTEELLLARGLGARVAWLDPTGQVETGLADRLPLGDHGILELPNDPLTLRGFIMRALGPLEPDELRTDIAKYLHDSYRRQQRSRKPPGDPALAPWNELLPSLQESNLAAADDVECKLALIGLRLVKGGARLVLDDQQVALLGEEEHGRWNVERLSAGWELGDRHVGRAISPDLRPWSELSEDVRKWDYEAVENLAAALAAAKYGVEPLRAERSGPL
jgi:hypothetical protein